MTTLKQIHSIDELIVGHEYLFELGDYYEDEPEDMLEAMLEEGYVPIKCRFKAILKKLTKNKRIEGRVFNVCVFKLTEYSPKCLRHPFGRDLFLKDNGSYKKKGDTITMNDLVDDELFYSSCRVYESPIRDIVEKRILPTKLPTNGNRDLVLHTTGYLRGGYLRGGRKTRKHKRKRGRTGGVRITRKYKGKGGRTGV